MAEALGTVTSILQLINTVLTAKDCIQDFVHAPQEQRKLLLEMADLQPLLEELQDRIVANPLGGILQRMKRPLADFKGTMERFTEKLRPEQFKTLLNSWLLVDLWDMGQQHQGDRDVLLRSVKDVADTVNSGVTNITNSISQQLQRMDSAERGQIIEWLSPINFFLRHSDISSAQEELFGAVEFRVREKLCLRLWSWIILARTKISA
ncbi:SesA domain-containing protein [Mycena venus]|uniref:SesA domain-containing protein n=1 Tax=Mycena venus TaxID=2733690 RepID=A0A8H7D920_9AGAR|nr:SesA domain-containing protein [Mycena venus]